jgi:hypothetical protein
MSLGDAIIMPISPERRSARRPVRFAVAVTALATTAVLAAAGVSAATAATPRAAAAWRVVRSLRTDDNLSLVPVSNSTAWLFKEPASADAKPTAWLLTASGLTRYPFPGQEGQGVSGAATGPANAWAFSQTRVFSWDGSKWQVAHAFDPSVFLFGVLPVSSTSVLVFGSAGTWHYNGSTWSREPSGYGLAGASALSAHSAWAVDSGDGEVAHWNGATWKRTSLARLLPPSPELCHYGLTSVEAVSASDVWVLAAGNCQDFTGPLLILHYDGHHWARAPLTGSFGRALGAAPDGQALWLAVSGGAGGGASLYRYLRGSMGPVKLPTPAAAHTILSAPAAAPGAPGVTYELQTRFSPDFTSGTTYVLRYAP